MASVRPGNACASNAIFKPADIIRIICCFCGLVFALISPIVVMSFEWYHVYDQSLTLTRHSLLIALHPKTVSCLSETAIRNWLHAGSKLGSADLTAANESFLFANKRAQ